MSIERTAFGSITIDGKTYEHDVIIRLSGKVEKRQKKLSGLILEATRLLISIEEFRQIVAELLKARGSLLLIKYII